MNSRHATTTLTVLITMVLATAACTTPGASVTSRPDTTPAASSDAPATGATPVASPGSSLAAATTASTAPAVLVTPAPLASTAAGAGATVESRTAAPLASTAAALPAALESPRAAPPLEGLVNADGSPFRLIDTAGTPTLVFFGYTHCPDICPSTIGELFGVFQARPEVQAVFVSVDPERDTPEFMAKWTEYFPDNFHAVTGTPGAIRRAADGYGVRYARVETSSKAGYTMSHTANVYLIDGDGQLRHIYPFGTPAAQMAADIATMEAG